MISPHDKAAVDAAWRRCLDELKIGDACCIYQNRDGPNKRVYVAGDRVYKIRLRHIALASGRKGKGGLKREYTLLSRTPRVEGVPRPIDYYHDEHHEVAVYDRVDAAPLAEQNLTLRRVGRVGLRLARILYQLARAGIAHNDLGPRNVLVNDRGGVYLVDFDQATCHAPPVCLYRSFLKRYGHNFCDSWLTLMEKETAKRVWKPLGALIGVVGHRRDEFHRRVVSDGWRAVDAGAWKSGSLAGLKAIAAKPLQWHGWRILACCCIKPMRAGDPVRESSDD